jgi:hypothetical protein
MGRFLLAALIVPLVCAQAPSPPPDASVRQVPPPSAAPAPGPEAVVQQLFDGMAARDALAVKALFVPDAGIFSLGTNGKANKMPLDDFINVIGSGKAEWRERIWTPTVLVHGPIAVVWAPYDFHLSGSFTHCGYDSISLLKTTAGWKITYISDTRETEGCQNPLGPPTR